VPDRGDRSLAQVLTSRPHTIEEQLSWDTLPEQAALEASSQANAPPEVLAATVAASAGQGGAVSAPWSAGTPAGELVYPAAPALARVAGNLRLTDAHASCDIRHIVLDFGQTAMPVLEGQSLGVQPPGVDASGRPHHVRLYSIASPRDGERPNYNNLSITVKRVTEDHSGAPARGLCSNYLCDLKAGDEVRVVGPLW